MKKISKHGLPRIDVRGLPCPQPVIRTRKFLQNGPSDKALVILDSPTARDNVSAMARSLGWAVEIRKKGEEFHLILSRQQDVPKEPSLAEKPAGSGVCIVTSEFLGRGNDELGRTLIQMFFSAMLEALTVPEVLIFINSGVRLTCEGSPVLETLEGISGRGTRIMSCGTCLDYFHLKEKLKIGEITNMYTIVEHFLGAARIITA